jgi:hypothetical protein
MQRVVCEGEEGAGACTYDGLVGVVVEGDRGVQPLLAVLQVVDGGDREALGVAADQARLLAGVARRALATHEKDNTPGAQWGKMV